MTSLDIEKDLNYIGKDLKDKNDKKIYPKINKQKTKPISTNKLITQILKKIDNKEKEIKTLVKKYRVLKKLIMMMRIIKKL